LGTWIFFSEKQSKLPGNKRLQKCTWVAGGILFLHLGRRLHEGALHPIQRAIHQLIPVFVILTLFHTLSHIVCTTNFREAKVNSEVSFAVSLLLWLYTGD
jgi:hypothetical protein